ncbi:response regulator [Cohnella sp. AR92]|uniref:response regulator n=1 Tax=Cohnella sp. AR92 TaxID=648716 RepID=UPI000F8D2D06|nr:response regulator [Cohnella sp. AR92]RUS43296.1 response regulator [Cohnella sp. AR92]
MLRAIVVDDEELSVRRLEKMLFDSGEIDRCQTFLNSLGVCEYVRTNPIDVAFLDIAMPGISGMELAERLHAIDPGIEVVFVTAYNHYAVEAFDRSALDYLIKPATAERLSQTLNRIKARRRTELAKPALEVRLFNGLKAFTRNRLEEPLKLRSPKTEELFAFLLCRGSVTREEIVDTLWSGLELEKAWKNLNSTLYYIRKAIDTDNAGGIIVAGRNEIRIEESGITCDLYEFERLLKQIRLNPAKSHDLFQRAKLLYAGPLLNGKGYDWAGEQSRRLEASYLELLEAAARLCLEQNEANQSLQYFVDILKWDPIREDIAQETIRLYIELGRKTEALRQYHRLEESLRLEFGTLPDPRISELLANANS